MQLLDQRVAQLWGDLDGPAVSRACAELILLDATGDGPVQLYMGVCNPGVAEAWPLVDTVDLLGAPVHVTCLGSVEGARLAVAAAGARSVAAPHAQFHLRLPPAAGAGNARRLEGWERQEAQLASQFAARLAPVR